MRKTKCPKCEKRVFDISKLPTEKIEIELKCPNCRKFVNVVCPWILVAFVGVRVGMLVSVMSTDVAGTYALYIEPLVYSIQTQVPSLHLTITVKLTLICEWTYGYVVAGPVYVACDTYLLFIVLFLEKCTLKKKASQMTTLQYKVKRIHSVYIEPSG